MLPMRQHQGQGGQLWISVQLAGSNLWIETPNKQRRHWWGELQPQEQPVAPSIHVLSTVPAKYARDRYVGAPLIDACTIVCLCS